MSQRCYSGDQYKYIITKYKNKDNFMFSYDICPPGASRPASIGYMSSIVKTTSKHTSRI